MSTCCFKFKKLLGAFATCTALAAGAYAPSAFASVVSDNSLFELDHSVTNPSTSNSPDTLDSNCTGTLCNTQPSKSGTTAPFKSDLPDDWNDFGSNGTDDQVKHLGYSHADVSTGIVTDDVERVFSKGSKDEQDVSAWDFRAGSSPPKADMTHAYAASYSHDATGTSIPLVVFFGSNRGSFTGTTENGYWFFKQRISIDDATGKFSGHHCDGDLLVTVAYTNGGSIGNMRVRKWADTSGDPCDGIGGTLADVLTSANDSGISGRFCDASGTGTPGADNICAGSNFATITLPWAPGEGSPGQFLEGGLSVAGLTGEDKPCFASFMATSRSSAQKKSETKNFILREFPVCKLEVVKDCEFQDLVTINNETHARFAVFGQVTNSGGGTLTNITLTDNPTLDTGSLGFFTCDTSGKPTTTPQPTSSLVPGGTICYKATLTNADPHDSTSSDEITAHGTSGGATIDSKSDSASCSKTFEGVPVLTKNCGTCLDDTSVSGKVILNTSFGGTLCNSQNFAFSNVKITDQPLVGDVTSIVVKDTGGNTLTNGSFTLGAGTTASPTCVSYTGSYLPAHALNKLVAGATTLNPDKAQFKDTVKAFGTRPLGEADEALDSEDATCNLCINPTTPGTRCDPPPI